MFDCQYWSSLLRADIKLSGGKYCAYELRLRSGEGVTVAVAMDVWLRVACHLCGRLSKGRWWSRLLDLNQCPSFIIIYLFWLVATVSLRIGAIGTDEQRPVAICVALLVCPGIDTNWQVELSAASSEGGVKWKSLMLEPWLSWNEMTWYDGAMQILNLQSTRNLSAICRLARLMDPRATYYSSYIKSCLERRGN